MARFKYRARNERGKVFEGYVEAEDQPHAVNVLRQDGLVALALSVVEGEKSGASLWESLLRIGTVPHGTKRVFFRQMATMSRAGVTLLSAADILIEQEGSLIFKDILLDMRDGLNYGLPLSQAMQKHRLFTPLEIAMVQAGEEGGGMSDALDRVASLLERQAALRGKIRGALLYPAFVAAFSLVVLAVFLTLILPQFKQVFEAMNIELPRLTQALCAAGDYCAAYWRVLVLAAALGLLSLLLIFRQPWMDRVKLALPVFGKLMFHASLARSSQTLATLTAAGVPILQAVEMAADTAGNGVVRKGFLLVRDRIAQGVSLADASRNTRIFPTLVTQMMRIGEETGHLDSMMERVAFWYDQELEGQIKVMTALLGPAAIILVGGVVALIALSVFGPIMTAMSEIR